MRSRHPHGCDSCGFVIAPETDLLQLTLLVHLAIGKGIEKVVEDYAAEVAKAMQV